MGPLRHLTQPEQAWSSDVPRNPAADYAALPSRLDIRARASQQLSTTYDPYYPFPTSRTLRSTGGGPMAGADRHTLWHAQVVPFDPLPVHGGVPVLGVLNTPGAGVQQLTSASGPGFDEHDHRDDDHHHKSTGSSGVGRLPGRLGGFRARRTDVKHLRPDAPGDDGESSASAGAKESRWRPGKRNRRTRDLCASSAPSKHDNDLGDSCRLRLQHGHLGLCENGPTGPPRHQAGVRRRESEPGLGRVGLEGLAAVVDRRAVRPRVLIFVGVATAVLLIPAGSAWGNDAGGQYWTSSASGSAGDGGVQVGASYGGSGPGTSPTDAAAQGAGVVSVTPGCGTTDVVLAARDQALMGPGGPTPGVWEVPDCHGIGSWGAFWVPTGRAAGPPVDPAVLGRQALSKLNLSAPTIEMAPPTNRDQLVNVDSWLWVESVAWRSMSAT